MPMPMKNGYSKFLNGRGMDPTTGLWGMSGLTFGINTLTGEALKNPVETAAKSVLEAATWVAFNPIGDAIITGTLAYSATKAIYNGHKKGQQYNLRMMKPNFGGKYLDTQQSLTMRQKAVQAIQGSRLNARSALGNEASLMHR